MGTHPIFESDFDCLTEMVGFEDFADFVFKSDHNGRVRLCVRFITKDGVTEKFHEKMKKGIAITLKEKGCKQYEMVTDHKLTNTFWLLEDWDTREDLKAHLEEQKRSGIPNIKPYMAEGADFIIMK